MWNETRERAADTEVAQVCTRAASVWLESPLVGARDVLKAHVASTSTTFRLAERAFLDLVNLRGDASDPVFVAAVERVTGAHVPTRPNTVAPGRGCDVLWLGPDEWLVRSLQPQPAAFEVRLTQAFEGQFSNAVDVGSGYTVLEIGGTGVREVLARGCPLDLHPHAFKQGQCAQSVFFKASIVLLPTASYTFDVVVRRSFADYVCRIMLDAAAPLLS
ncbi:sarcosine oxidase subunit gamma [Paraburkholderia bannensis]|uniref:sarcosine oxidase subunit gamma n=1 Tax=Paraburkholderia bannensis TaxID=765414 RepID=UPI002ABE7519|nr:sarcosine oxidase subunit gamma [Paraburkholderia bannensis]